MTLFVEAALLPERTRGRSPALGRHARGQGSRGGDKRRCTPVVAKHRGRLESSPHSAAGLQCVGDADRVRQLARP